ncbi:MAG: translocation/assembly module TamB domain-containing protein [Pseudomonadota bacterium]
MAASAGSARRRWSWVLLLAGVPVLTGLGALALAASPAGNRWLLLRGIEAADALLPHAHLAVDDLRTDVLRTIALRGVRLEDSAGRSLIALDALEIRWRPVELLRGRLHLEQVVLRGPEVDLALDAEGHLDLLHALGLDTPSLEPAGAWEGLPIDITVDRVRVLDGDVRFTQAGAATWSAADLDLAVGLSLEGRAVRLERAVAAAQVRHGGLPAEGLPFGLSGGALLADDGVPGSPQDLTLRDLRLRLGQAGAGAGGRIAGLGGAPHADLRLDLVDLDPAGLVPVIPDLGIEGPFAAHLTLAGPLDALALDGTLRAPPGAGDLRLALSADVQATPPTWALRLDLDAVEPQRFVPALPEPFHLQGTVHAEGAGLSWPDDLAGHGGLALESGVAWGIPFGGLSAHLGVEGGQIALEDLAFATALGRGHAQGSVDPAAPAFSLGFDVTDVPLAALDRFGVEGLRGRGAAQGTLALTSGARGVALAVDGSVQVREGAYQDQATAGWLQGPVSLRWSAAGLTVSGQAQARRIASHSAEAASLAGPWRVEIPAGGGLALQAEPTVVGARYGPFEAGRVRLAVRGDTARGAPIVLAVGFDAADLALPTLGLPDLAMDRAAGDVSLEGALLGVRVEGRRADRPILAATVSLDLDSGALHAPALAVAPREDVAWVAVEPVRATLTAEGVRDLRAHLANGDAQLWADGSLDPRAGADLRLMGSKISLAPLAALAPAAPGGLSGAALFALHAHGPLDDLGLDGSVEVAGFTLPGRVQDLDARVVLHGGRGRLALQAFALEPRTRDEPEEAAPKPSGTLAWIGAEVPARLSLAGATLDPHAPWSAEAILAPGETRRLGRLLALDGLPAGRASAHLLLGGTPAATTLHVGLALETPVGDEGQLLRLDATLDEADSRALLDAALSRTMQRQATLTAQATTDLPTILAAWLGAPGVVAPDAAEITSWVRDLNADIAPLGVTTDVLGRMVSLPAGIGGSLRGGLHVQGDPRRPQLSGALQLADARLGGLPVAPAMLSLAPQEGGYQLDTILGFAGGGLDISGFVPMSLEIEPGTPFSRLLEQDGLDLAISGPGVPVAAIAGLLGEPEGAAGCVAVIGRVTGTLAAPRPDLDLAMSGGSLLARQLGLSFDELALQAHIAPGRLTLAQLSGGSRPATEGGGAIEKGLAGGRGTLDARGWVELEGFRPALVHLDVRADHFWAAARPRERLQISGALTADGHWPALQIRGDATVGEALFVADDALWLYSGTLELDPRMRIVRGDDLARVAPIEPPPWYRDLEVDLSLDLARAASVQVQMPLDDAYGALEASLASILLEARLDGTLDLGFSQGELSLLGEVRPVYGRADIVGARFALADGGTVSFMGDEPFDPALQLTAVHDAGRYGEIGVDIGGTLSALDLGFQSDEYPDPTDIMAILLFGSPLSDLSANQGQARESAITAATSLLLGEIERRGAGSRLVDMVELGGGVYKAGRAVGDDLFVTLAVKPEARVDEGENITEVTVDWTITRAWSAEFVTGDQGKGSADLFWSVRF